VQSLKQQEEVPVTLSPILWARPGTPKRYQQQQQQQQEQRQRWQQYQEEMPVLHWPQVSVMQLMQVGSK
jgi:hypothetical protein